MTKTKTRPKQVKHIEFKFHSREKRTEEEDEEEEEEKRDWPPVEATYTAQIPSKNIINTQSFFASRQ